MNARWWVVVAVALLVGCDAGGVSSRAESPSQLLERASVELARQLAALPAERLAGLAVVESQTLVEVRSLVVPQTRARDTVALQATLSERLRAGAPAFAWRRASTRGMEPAGVYSAGLPLLVMGSILESQSDQELTVVLRAFDPLRERLLALAVVGTPPPRLAEGLTQLREKLQAAGAAGWPEGATPLIQVGPVVDMTPTPVDADRVGAWTEDALFRAQVETALVSEASQVARHVREVAARDGVAIDPALRANPTHTLEGAVSEDDPGTLRVSLAVTGGLGRPALASVQTTFSLLR